MMFGLIKILSLLLFLLFAIRWWAFEGDAKRAAAPGILFFKGLGLFMLIEFGGESLMRLVGQGLSWAAGPTIPMMARIAIGIRIDADQFGFARLDSGLLHQLA